MSGDSDSAFKQQQNNNSNYISLPAKNAENTALENEVNAKQRKLSLLRGDIEQLENKAQLLWTHMQNLRQEIHQNQGILRAKQTELESEKRFLELVRRDQETAKSSIRKLEEQIRSVGEKRTKHEATLSKQKNDLEQRRQALKFSKEDFHAHLNQVLEADELNVDIQKYLLKDERTVTDLTVHLEKLCDERSKSQRRLEKLNTELRALELALQKAVAEHDSTNNERRSLIDQWEQTVAQLHNRDAELDQLAEQLTQLRTEAASCLETLAKAEHQEQLQQAIHGELLRRINAKQAQLTKLKADQLSLETKKQTNKDTLIVSMQDSSLANANLANLLEQQRQLSQALQEKETMLEKLRKQKEEAKGKTNNVSKTPQVSMDQLLHHEEEREKTLSKRKAEITSQLRKQQQKTISGKRDEAGIQETIEGSKLLSKNLNDKLKQLKRHAEKKEQDLRSQDELAESVERQLQAAAISKPENRLQNTDQQNLDSLRQTAANLQLSIQNIETSIRKIQIQVTKLNQDQDQRLHRKTMLETKAAELTAIAENSEKTRRKIIAEKHNLMVESNMLKLEIKRLQTAHMNSEAAVKKVGVQEEHAINTLKARHADVVNMKTALITEYGQATDERKQHNQRFKEYLNKIDQLRNKYDIVTLSMRPPVGDVGNLEEYYLSKHDREKTVLHSTSEQLDNKMRKAEKEMLALANTVKLAKQKNALFNQRIADGFDMVTPGEKTPLDIKSELKTKIVELETQIAEQNQQRLMHSETIRHLELEAKELESKSEKCTKQIEDNQRNLEELRKDIANKEAQLDELKNQMKKNADGFRRHNNQKSTVIATDIDLRRVQETNEVLDKLLDELGDVAPEMRDFFAQQRVAIAQEAANIKDNTAASTRATSRRTSTSNATEALTSSTVTLNNTSKKLAGTYRSTVGKVSLVESRPRKQPAPTKSRSLPRLGAAAK